ncbi:MAG: hypothetical protein A3E25_15825 [Burkholderiales bacterium RIFCSPHIGHO2_12_FULL_69_20]|nr:MAG: hypothetical protein A3E25_15825 [Burkholderiales bacterium RIFCSPHIGHO2_12_FULL_69_20]
MNSLTSASSCAAPRSRSPVVVDCTSAPSTNTLTASASTAAGRSASGTTLRPSGQKPSRAFSRTLGR